MHWPPDAGDAADPRHVFLNAHEVMARYSWGKTKGYQNLKDRALVPPPVMTHPDRWRLDQLLAWEEKRMELAEAPWTRSSRPGGGSRLSPTCSPNPSDDAEQRRERPSRRVPRLAPSTVVEPVLKAAGADRRKASAATRTSDFEAASVASPNIRELNAPFMPRVV